MKKKIKVDLYHNILWPRYKSEFFKLLTKRVSSNSSQVDFRITHFARTESNRVNLNADWSVHDYKYKLLHGGTYRGLPILKIWILSFCHSVRSDADIVLLPGWSYLPCWIILLVSALRGKKLGVFCDSTINDNEFSYFKHFSKKLFLSKCDIAFTYGEMGREYLKSLGFNESKVITRCQTSGGYVRYNQDEILTYRVNYVNPHVINILYVGRLSPEKNLLQLLIAYNKFIYLYPASSLTIVGEGPQRLELERFVQKYSIANVNFVGAAQVDEVYTRMLSASFLVLPSISEPWGLVVNEALECGCPAIISNRCGCSHEFGNSDSTIIFDVKKQDSLFDAIVYAVDKFTNVKYVSQNCLDLVSCFTPVNAANNVFYGVRKLYRENFD